MFSATAFTFLISKARFRSGAIFSKLSPEESFESFPMTPCKLTQATFEATLQQNIFLKNLVIGQLVLEQLIVIFLIEEG